MIRGAENGDGASVEKTNEVSRDTFLGLFVRRNALRRKKRSDGKEQRNTEED